MMDSTQLEFGGLRSSVVVDSSNIPHYGIQHDEGTKAVTSWIVSEPDKPFAIHSEIINLIPGEDYSVQVFLDGHKVAGRVFRPHHSPVYHVESTRVSHTETQKFMFGSLELSDDDTLLEASNIKALGEIKILFYRVGTLIPAAESYTAPPQPQKVHERAKKGLAHSVKYGGTQIDPLKTTPKHFFLSNQTLIASHMIRYRPLAMLQAIGVVPRVSDDNGQAASKSPSPVPGPSKNSKKRKLSGSKDVKPVIDLSDDDEEDIIKKEKELKEQLAQLQKKRDRIQQQPAKKVKQEEMKPTLRGEIIDLTI